MARAAGHSPGQARALLQAHDRAPGGGACVPARGHPALRPILMQTRLADWIRETPEGIEADSILRKCVHCGFCLATCPTYTLLGDELDSPRGRIYLMKQMLEGAPVTER